MSENQGPKLTATTTVLLVLATVFVGFRFLSRYLSGGIYGRDDFCMVAALVAAFGAGSINYGMIASGLGQHADTLTQPQLITFFKLLVAFECVYVTGVALVKLSVLLMYLRIFPSRTFRIVAAIIGSTVIGWCLAIILVSIFQCQPIRKAWLPWLPEGHCIDLKASFIGNAIPNIVSDVAILCMPVGAVLRLQINTYQKALVLFMFLLGSFVLFASIYRFTTIMQFDTADTTWTLATACTWCVVEVCCGAISGCLPTLRPMVLLISRKLGTLPGSKKSGTDGTGPSKGISGGGTGGNSRGGNLALVTFGGTGAPSRSRQGPLFHRLSSDRDTDSKKYGVETCIHEGSSDDQLPLTYQGGDGSRDGPVDNPVHGNGGVLVTSTVQQKVHRGHA